MQLVTGKIRDWNAQIQCNLFMGVLAENSQASCLYKVEIYSENFSWSFFD